MIIESAENATHRVEIVYDEYAASDSPRDWTNVGTFITWHRGYNSPDDNPFATPDDFLRAWNPTTADRCPECGNDGTEAKFGVSREATVQPLETTTGTGEVYCPWCGCSWEPGSGDGTGGVLLDVYMIEHGNIAYRATEHGAHKPYMGTDWDTGQVGFIYCTAEDIVREWNGTRDKAVEYLAGEVETYSQWANGEVYGAITYTKVKRHIVTTHANGEASESEEEAWEEDEACWGFYGLDVTNGMKTNFGEEYADLFDKVLR